MSDDAKGRGPGSTTSRQSSQRSTTSRQSSQRSQRESSQRQHETTQRESNECETTGEAFSQRTTTERESNTHETTEWESTQRETSEQQSSHADPELDEDTQHTSVRRKLNFKANHKDDEVPKTPEYGHLIKFIAWAAKAWTTEGVGEQRVGEQGAGDAGASGGACAVPRRRSSIERERHRRQPRFRGHVLGGFPATAKKKRPYRKCHVCRRKNKKNKEVPTQCIRCRVPLCAVGCYEAYHTRDNYEDSD